MYMKADVTLANIYTDCSMPNANDTRERSRTVFAPTSDHLIVMRKCDLILLPYRAIQAS